MRGTEGLQIITDELVITGRDQAWGGSPWGVTLGWELKNEVDSAREERVAGRVQYSGQRITLRWPSSGEGELHISEIAKSQSTGVEGRIGKMKR